MCLKLCLLFPEVNLGRGRWNINLLIHYLMYLSVLPWRRSLNTLFGTWQYLSLYQGEVGWLCSHFLNVIALDSLVMPCKSWGLVLYKIRIKTDTARLIQWIMTPFWGAGNPRSCLQVCLLCSNKENMNKTRIASMSSVDSPQTDA